MQIRKPVVAAILSVLCLNLCPAARLHAEDASARETMLEVVRGLRSPIRIDQMDAIARAGSITDKQVVTDFKLQDILTAIVSNKTLRSDMRRLAMRSLLQLARKELLSDSLLDDLRRVADDRKDELESRLDAVDLIAELGAGNKEGLQADEARKKVVGALKDIASSSINEEALRAAAYLALGGFPGNRDTLLKGAKDITSARIRAAALTGLARYIMLSKLEDSKLAFQIVGPLMQQQASRDEQIAGIDCLTALARNGYEISDQETIKFLFGIFSQSTDDDMVERVAICLLYTSADQALPVAAAFLKNLRAPTVERSVRVQIVLLKGLDNLVDKLSIQMREGKDSATVTRAMTAITEFISKIITHENADGRLIDIATISLGGVPRDFDRTAVVESLIAGLKLHPGKAQAIENSLLQYKRGNALHDIDDKPDPEQWAKWFEENKDKLQPGQAPYL